MLDRCLIGATLLVLALGSGFASAQGFDDAKYPNLKGQWVRVPVPGKSGPPSSIRRSRRDAASRRR